MIKQGITFANKVVTVVDRIDNQTELETAIKVLHILKQFLPRKEETAMADLARQFPMDD